MQWNWTWSTSESGIYRIRCEANGAVYIGQAANLGRRLTEHRSHLRAGTHKNAMMQATWAKYGEASFTFAVMVRCPREKDRLYELELAVWGLYKRAGTRMMNLLMPAPSHWTGSTRPGMGSNLRDPALRAQAIEAWRAWRRSPEGVSIMAASSRRGRAKLRANPEHEARRKAAAAAAQGSPELRALRSEQMKTQYATGARTPTRTGLPATNRKAITDTVSGRTWPSLSAAAADTGIQLSTLSTALSGKRKMPKGFNFVRCSTS